MQNYQEKFNTSEKHPYKKNVQRGKYLRDLIKEKDILDKEEEHSGLTKLLTQGKKNTHTAFQKCNLKCQHVQLHIIFKKIT